MKLIAFDSGLERTGWAVFGKKRDEYILDSYDCIITPKSKTLPERIYQLSEEVQALVRLHSPSHFVLERLFFSANTATAMTVAQAQGAVLSVAGEHHIQTAFLTPQEIKQTMTGYGRSDKKGVQKMVQLLLHVDPLPLLDDTVDAIACGFTYCTMMKPDL